MFLLQSPRIFHTGDVQPNKSDSTLVLPDRESDLRLIELTQRKKTNSQTLTHPAIPTVNLLNPSLLIKSILSLETFHRATFAFVTPSDSRSEGSVFCPLYCARHARVHTFKGRAGHRTVCIHHISTKAKLRSSGCSEFVIFTRLKKGKKNSYFKYYSKSCLSQRTFVRKRDCINKCVFPLPLSMNI